MNRLIKRSLTWPLCLLFVAGLVLGGNGSVLCVGDDGLLKVEPVCQPCSTELGEACDLEVADSGHDHQDYCDNCTDLHLYQNSLSPRTQAQTAGARLIDNSLLVRLTAPIDCFVSLVMLEPTGSDAELPSAIDFLATIVLRC